jgi:ATP-dependent RNA helicase DeaD
METESAPSAVPTFSALALSPETLRSLQDMGYNAPTNVQAETIPLALAGKDLVVQSRTGTGKTAAFGIPMVERIDAGRESVQAVVLAPTRELALQVAAEIEEIGRGRRIKVLSVYGGDSMERQVDGINAGAQVIAGTPGRVLDHLRRGTLDFSGVRFFVLDEADRMLDMGFEDDMEQILKAVPTPRQTAFFSATFPRSIEAMSRKH